MGLVWDKLGLRSLYFGLACLMINCICKFRSEIKQEQVIVCTYISAEEKQME